MPVSVTYADEHADKGPLVCVQVYFDGARTMETCDRKHRSANEKWDVGVLDVGNGKIFDRNAPPAAAAPAANDAGIADAARDR
jgi:hypothetical protein